MSTDPTKPQPEKTGPKSDKMDAQDARAGRRGSHVAIMVIVGLALAVIAGFILFGLYN